MTPPIGFYRAVLRALKSAGLPFLIGGTYAMARYTAIDRKTKDLDLMVRRNDWPDIARALRAQGIYTRLVFPHWLGKALEGRAQVDIIFSGGNGITRVDDDWFTRATPSRVLGFNALLCPAEELLWSKAFVMERERFDGADVLHLILKQGPMLDWLHLCDRFRGHERVLLVYALLFEYVYPGEQGRIPDWVVPRLLETPVAPAIAGDQVCRGTLISREQFLVDVEKWGYADARLPPYGPMSPRELAIWTNAIKEHWSQDRRGRRPRLPRLKRILAEI
jgi:hypothetical protein